MPSLRIRLAHLPALMRDILTASIASQPDIELVSADGDDADVLVTAGGPLLSATSMAFLKERNSHRVLALSEDGRSALLFDASLNSKRLGDLSLAELVTALRAAV